MILSDTYKQLLQSPELLRGKKEDLLNLIETYPYFQGAALLLLKQLSLEQDVDFELALRKYAVLAPDRKQLYYFLRQEISTTETIANADKEKTVDIPANPDSQMDELDKLIISSAMSHGILEDVETEELSEIEIPEKPKEEPIKENVVPELKIKPEPEAQSFSDWLSFYSYSSEEDEIELPAQKKNPQNIVEDFLKNQQEKPKTPFYSPTSMARKSVEEHDDLVTETLAKVYAAQGNFEKSIQAYKKLQEKYPEKRVYFAARIKELDSQQE